MKGGCKIKVKKSRKEPTKKLYPYTRLCGIIYILFYNISAGVDLNIKGDFNNQ